MKSQMLELSKYSYSLDELWQMYCRIIDSSK